MGKANWKVITRGSQNTTYATLVANSKISGNLTSKTDYYKIEFVLYLGFETFSDI